MQNPELLKVEMVTLADERAELKRVEVPSVPLSERHGGFSEVELCFSDEQVKEETHRCLQCDLEICLAEEAGCIQKN